jgi:hypothetical protein
LDSWSENPILRKDLNKLFVARNVDSAFFAYHLNQNPMLLMEYFCHERKFSNVFELIEEEVIRVGEEMLKLTN